VSAGIFHDGGFYAAGVNALGCVDGTLFHISSSRPFTGGRRKLKCAVPKQEQNLVARGQHRGLCPDARWAALPGGSVGQLNCWGRLTLLRLGIWIIRHLHFEEQGRRYYRSQRGEGDVI